MGYSPRRATLSARWCHSTPKKGDSIADYQLSEPIDNWITYIEQPQPRLRQRLSHRDRSRSLGLINLQCTYSIHINNLHLGCLTLQSSNLYLEVHLTRVHQASVVESSSLLLSHHYLKQPSINNEDNVYLCLE